MFFKQVAKRGTRQHVELMRPPLGQRVVPTGRVRPPSSFGTAGCRPISICRIRFPAARKSPNEGEVDTPCVARPEKRFRKINVPQPRIARSARIMPLDVPQQPICRLSPGEQGRVEKRLFARNAERADLVSLKQATEDGSQTGEQLDVLVTVDMGRCESMVE